jgi:FkbM family methyltransferase
MTTLFTYNNNEYIIDRNDQDPSTYGCINEIVNNNEYLLHNFTDNKDQYFLDIGANCGIATIILAKQNPASTIISFEPDPTVFKVLEKNVIMNNLTNVKLHNKAVSKKDTKTLKLILWDEYSGANTTCSFINDINNFAHKNLSQCEVECICLDEIIDTYSINNIKLLKIDCEGAEYEILYGSEYFKNGMIENMVGEFHNLPYNTSVSSNSAELIQYCRPFVSGIFKITILTIGSSMADVSVINN